MSDSEREARHERGKASRQMTEERIDELWELVKWQRQPYPNEPERKITAVTAYNRIVPELLEEVERLRCESQADGTLKAARAYLDANGGAK